MITPEEAKRRRLEYAARAAHQAFIDRRAMAIQRYHQDPEFGARIKTVIAAIHQGRGDSAWTAAQKRDAFADAISAVIALDLIAEARERQAASA